MRIFCGHTRIAFVFREIVVKVPRVRVFKACRVLWRYFVFREMPMQVANKRYRRNPIMLLLVYLGSGFTANRREFFHSRAHPFAEYTGVMPVYYLFAGGVVEIQQRGLEINEKHPAWNKVQRALQARGVSNIDLCKPDHFSVWNGAICIHDCGARETVTALAEGGYEALREANQGSPLSHRAVATRELLTVAVH